MSVDCIKTNNFLKDEKIDLNLGDNTMYQSDFKFPKGYVTKKSRRRYDTSDEHEDIPRFFETQNKLDFLNWGGKNFVPSMKPKEKPAITNAQFTASSIYKSDFEGRASTSSPFVTREAGLMKFGCASSMMKTNYHDEFSMKRTSGPEIDCKPAHVEATICKKFKGSTEYKRQYIKNKKDDSKDEHIPTIEELQTLIIDL